MTQNEQTVTATITFPFSDEDIDLHIMGSGFNMWEWWQALNNQPSEGFIGVAAENPYDGGVVTKRVLYDDIRRVIGEILSGQHDFTIAREQLANGNLDEIDLDADGADQIMQIAVFGKVVFS